MGTSFKSFFRATLRIMYCVDTCCAQFSPGHASRLHSQPGKAFPKWEAKLKQKLGGKQYLVEVTTAIDSPVGKYENVCIAVSDFCGSTMSMLV